jgi:purine nucleosidase/pyrimidine-specific ribonucleoside hydrolase
VTEPVILDCDPGHDDALALILAAANPELHLLGVTTVAGNQTLAKTTVNTQKIMEAAGIADIPVAAGCAKPLRGDLRVAEDIHGASGLDGPTFPTPTSQISRLHAVDLAHQLIMRSDQEVTVIATGPLTNIATLLTTYPDVRDNVRRIIFMGGSTERGNTTPYGEFNIVTDPEAADIVLRCGLPLVMCGLNVTHQALATPDVIARLAALRTDLADACVDLITFFASAYREVFGFPHPPVHDPVAVAYAIDPSIVRTTPASVVVEVVGEHTRGATVVDFDRRNPRTPNADVALTIDVEPFWSMIIDAVRASGTR